MKIFVSVLMFLITKNLFSSLSSFWSVFFSFHSWTILFLLRTLMKDVLTFPLVRVPSLLYFLCLFFWSLYFIFTPLLMSANPPACLLWMTVRNQRTDGKLSSEQWSLSALTLPDCVLGNPLGQYLLVFFLGWSFETPENTLLISGLGGKDLDSILSSKWGRERDVSAYSMCCMNGHLNPFSSICVYTSRLVSLSPVSSRFSSP